MKLAGRNRLRSCYSAIIVLQSGVLVLQSRKTITKTRTAQFIGPESLCLRALVLGSSGYGNLGSITMSSDNHHIAMYIKFSETPFAIG
jgi:hypothetical protein